MQALRRSTEERGTAAPLKHCRPSPPGGAGKWVVGARYFYLPAVGARLGRGGALATGGRGLVVTSGGDPSRVRHVFRPLFLGGPHIIARNRRLQTSLARRAAPVRLRVIPTLGRRERRSGHCAREKEDPRAHGVIERAPRPRRYPRVVRDDAARVRVPPSLSPHAAGAAVERLPSAIPPTSASPTARTRPRSARSSREAAPIR